MTEQEAEEAIKQFWESGWEALHPADPNNPDHVPFCFDDEAFDSSPFASWVRVTINWTVNTRTTQGRTYAKYNWRGVLMVQLFGPPNAGNEFLAGLCGDVRTVLQDKSFSVIDTQEASPPRKADSQDPRWAMRVVTVPFVVEVQT